MFFRHPGGDRARGRSRKTLDGSGHQGEDISGARALPCRKVSGMKDCCVVVADESRARFFTVEPVELPELESGPKLVEHEDLLNPEGRVSTGKLFADTGTTSGRAPLGGPGHGYDDHRERHQEEMGRHFARMILEHAGRLIGEHDAPGVVLAAPARMLDYVRKEVDILTRRQILIHTVAKDITRLTPIEIHKLLAREQLLPCRRRPGRPTG
jgi:protein required for attachment to host cells